jgi:parallel beta-helix repeat protein
VVAVILVIFAGMMVGVADEKGTQSLSKSAEYTPHNPIYINGNSGFTAANGVTGGNGTESNPYIIEGWDINASTADGIYIQHTDKYFIIRNCTIYGGKNNWKHGIYFYNVTNGEIENGDIYNNKDGICLYESPNNNNITANQIYNNSRYGILLYYSPNHNLRNNILENNTYNFGVSGSDISHFYQDIDTSNTINGKPIYYTIEQSDFVFDGIEVGYLGLVSCSNITVKNLNLTKQLSRFAFSKYILFKHQR